MVLVTLFLIFAGGMVTSTGSGLAVPDWPTTYGYQMFSFPISEMVGGIFYEHGHRLIAAIVGCLTVVFVVWVWFKENRLWIRRLACLTLLTVVLQGLLGGITVLFFLPTGISVFHAVLAQTFFCFTIILAYAFSKDGRSQKQNTEKYKRLFIYTIILTILVYFQLVIGAIMRHTHSGLALLDFPFFEGVILSGFSGDAIAEINSSRMENWLDPVSLGQILIHSIHRIIGFAIGIFGIAIMWKFKGIHKKTLRLLWVLVSLIGIQIVLGGISVLTLKAPIITSIHVLTGAGILGLCVFISLRTLPVRDWLFMTKKSSLEKAGLEKV